MDNNRRRIELLHSLLFSFPGTPIIYYGDEIGMGDNIYLGDRNGVRTPMQWNGDRNAGFAGPIRQALQSGDHGPGLGIRGPECGSAAERSFVAAELDAQHDCAAKAVQCLWPRHSEFLAPPIANPGLYPEYQDERSLRGQSFPLRAAGGSGPAEFAGQAPVEMLGYVEFPGSRTAPYPLDRWPLRLSVAGIAALTRAGAKRARGRRPELQVNGAGDWMSVLEGNGRRELEESVLQAYWLGNAGSAASHAP